MASSAIDAAGTAKGMPGLVRGRIAADRRTDRTKTAGAARHHAEPGKCQCPVLPLIAHGRESRARQASIPAARSWRYWVCTLIS